MSLPPAAQQRMTASIDGGPWSSSQRVGEELALRRLGFSPVGIVIGSVNSLGVPYRGIRPVNVQSGYAYGYRVSTPWIDDPMSARRRGGYVHDWAVGSGTGLSMDMGWTWELVLHEQRERQLIGMAMKNIHSEARLLGAHGIIGIELHVRHLGTGATQSYPVVEVVVKGTAVAAPGRPGGDSCFTTGLSGSELLKLAEHGWGPVRFVAGLGKVQGLAGHSSRRALRSLKNGEVEQFSEIAQKSLEIAVRSMEHDSRSPFEVVIVGVQKVAAVKHFRANVLVTGSSVCHLGRGPDPAGPGYLRFVSLND